MTDWRQRARDLAAKLTTDGTITDSRWREAFENTPRHVFVPRYWALNEYNAPVTLVDGADATQRSALLDAAYTDQFLAIQWTPDGDHRIITSSASVPTLVARMLGILDVRDGHRILEIGTGSGYNTALLSARVGDARVVSVDIDPLLVAEAAARLHQIGYAPLVIAGDGADGMPSGAPYDRILSTCASAGVPAAWIDQLVPGGKIVAPFTFGGALAVLTKTGPGEVSGRFDAEQAWFMPLRPAGQSMPDGFLVTLPEPVTDEFTHYGTTDVDPDALADPEFRFWLGLHLPDGRFVDLVDDDTFARTGVIVHTATHRATTEFPVRDASPSRIAQDSRRLWDTVEAAWHAWQRHERPDRGRIGVTAYSNGTQRLWLDSPDSGHTWPLPG